LNVSSTELAGIGANSVQFAFPLWRDVNDKVRLVLCRHDVMKNRFRSPAIAGYLCFNFRQAGKKCCIIGNLACNAMIRVAVRQRIGEKNIRLILRMTSITLRT
jgi:hypothetical protein